MDDPARAAVGAPPDGAKDWQSIDWQSAERAVRRLQVRIAKAVREKRWGKVRALQRILTRSLPAKRLAVRRVTTNRGKRTPGIDGVAWNTSRKKMQAVAALKRRGYRPQPLKRVYIPKRNGRRRPLGMPTMKDRAMQALHLLALEPVAETLADPHSYGFRPRRSIRDAHGQCYVVLAKSYAPEWVFDADIEACFDRISHEWLLANVPMDKSILQKWLKAGYLEGQTLHATKEGTPQGGIISPVLANLALDGLEACVKESVPKRRLKSAPRSKNQVNRRLCGWANAFRHLVSSRAFRHVDGCVNRQLWRWACKRHGKKGKRWVWQRYYRRL